MLPRMGGRVIDIVRVVRVVLAVLAAVTLVVACGKTQRLKLVWLQASDGARSLRRANAFSQEFPEYLYDTSLHAHCTVARTKNGPLRCIPYDDDTAYAGIAYVDEACSVPVGYSLRDPTRSAPPKYAYDYERCVGMARVFEVGAQVTSSTRYYDRAPSGCSARNIGADSALYEVRELPMAELAQLSLETAEGPNRLRPTFLTSADGLRVLHGAQDNKLAVACSPSPVWMSDDVQCLPPEQAIASFSYADAACSRPVAHANVEYKCGRPVLARFEGVQRQMCDPLTYVPIASEMAAPAALFGRQVNSCARESPGVFSDDTFFETGPPVPLAPLTRRLDDRQSGARLHPYAYDDGLGLVFPSGRFRDSKEDYDCATGRREADGTFSCQPLDKPRIMPQRFSDAACTLPLEIFDEYPCDRRPPTPLVFVTGAHSEQERVLDVHTRGAAFTAPVFRSDGDDKRCRTDTRREEYGITYYVVGPLLRTVTMMELVEVVEP
jgi:hypothetical protein